MSRAGNCDQSNAVFVHRTAIFDRNIENLRRKGGTGSLAAEKADEVILSILSSKRDNARKQFRFTRNGEYRIKHCMKFDLGCGYRLVFIRKGRHYVFLYVGSHDEYYRWIERNKGLIYEMDDTTRAVRIICDSLSGRDEYEENPGEDEYEALLMSRIDDKILRKIFSGFVQD